MKSFSLKFLFVSAFVFIFAVQINAQLCGAYTTVLFIKTTEDKPVKNAVIQLLSIKKDETEGKTFVRDEKDLSKFSITFFEGHQLLENYKLLIFADGFENLEREITFPHCKAQNFDIRLTAERQTNLAVLSGTIYDANGAVIPKAKFTAINEKGEKFETRTNDEGIYVLNLPYNRYDRKNAANFRIANYEIIADFQSFQKFTLMNFKFVPSYKGTMNLDIALDIAETNNCGAGGCIRVEQKPIENLNEKVSDKILQKTLEQLPKK